MLRLRLLTYNISLFIFLFSSYRHQLLLKIYNSIQEAYCLWVFWSNSCHVARPWSYSLSRLFMLCLFCTHDPRDCVLELNEYKLLSINLFKLLSYIVFFTDNSPTSAINSSFYSNTRCFSGPCTVALFKPCNTYCTSVVRTVFIVSRSLLHVSPCINFYVYWHRWRY